MTIPRVWSSGIVSMPLGGTSMPILDSADAAALDANLQSAADKSAAGGAFYATVTLGPAGVISLDTSTSSFAVTSDSESLTGGRFVCGNGGDFPIFTGSLGAASPVTSLQHWISAGELCWSLGPATVSNGFWPILSTQSLNWIWSIDPSGSFYSGTATSLIPNGAAMIPITRMHDGATAINLSLWFKVSASRTGLPTGRYPGVAVVKHDPFLNQWSYVTAGWVQFATPANLAAYKGMQELTVSLGSVVVDLTKYAYYACLLDEDYGADAAGGASLANEFVGFYVSTSVNDMRFQ